MQIENKFSCEYIFWLLHNVDFDADISHFNLHHMSVKQFFRHRKVEMLFFLIFRRGHVRDFCLFYLALDDRLPPCLIK